MTGGVDPLKMLNTCHKQLALREPRHLDAIIFDADLSLVTALREILRCPPNTEHTCRLSKSLSTKTSFLLTALRLRNTRYGATILASDRRSLQSPAGYTHTHAGNVQTLEYIEGCLLEILSQNARAPGLLLCPSLVAYSISVSSPTAVPEDPFLALAAPAYANSPNTSAFAQSILTASGFPPWLSCRSHW
jgi:hypothetical protein